MKIEVKQNVNKCWYWKLIGNNGECIAVTEPYSSKAMCLKTVKMVSSETSVSYEIEATNKPKPKKGN